ncbi:MAG: hypothetical protein JO199_08775 [Candidatus Eremiobacteraeota bacterium]|nr:hypothetical protein [Candidatus Eremiobacteraeota bacterium]
MAFDLWPIMLVVEGPAEAIGAYLERLYDDGHVPRESWNVAHTHRSRQQYAQTLKSGGSEKQRLGVGVRTEDAALAIIERALAAGLGCARLSTKTQGAL